MKIRILCSVGAAVAVMVHGVATLNAIGWTNATGSLAHKLSECGTVTLLSPVPNSDAIIAGIAGRGLWRNTIADGSTWSRLDGNAASIPNRPSSIVYDPMNADVLWESGNYGPGLFKTTDGGRNFRRMGDVTHSDIISVDLSDPKRRTILAGGHEQNQTVYLSVDGGENWTNIGVNLPPGSGHSSHPVIVNSLTYLVDANNSAKLGGGIYRSRDGGDSWQRVSMASPTVAPLIASRGVIYWPARGILMRSVDFGATWSSVVERDVKDVTPIELPDGRIVAVGANTLIASSNLGATWAAVGPPFPFDPHGVMYSPQRKAFYIWRLSCVEEVPSNAIMMLDYDVDGVTGATPTNAPVSDEGRGPAAGPSTPTPQKSRP